MTRDDSKWESIVAAIKRGEDVEDELDDITGTIHTPRDTEAERVYEEGHRKNE